MAVLFFAACASAQQGGATLVLRNGRIWTGDATRPWAEAVAVQGDRIVAAGSNAEASALAGKSTLVLDLGGRFATPGINDAHIHFLGGALGLSEVDLNGARSLPEMQERIRAYSKAHPEKKWIYGAGWEYSYLPGQRLPLRQDLDAVVSDRPVYLRSYDGHTGWANSKALALAGVDRNTKFDGFGELVRDAGGNPTGVLKEGAQRLVRRVIPNPTREENLAALRDGMKLAASLGITSLQNASGSVEDLAFYEEAGKAQTLRVAIAMSSGNDTTAARLAEYAALSKKQSGPWLRVPAIKLVQDGVIETHTAALLDSYSDKPGDPGRATMTQEQINRVVADADRVGLQVYTHAIGDGAIRMALNAYANARRVNGKRDARHRIEHIETISRADIPRFAALDVIASMEPIHADPATTEVWSRAIGPERTKMGFAWRALELAGARLAFSSDWPACISLDPIRGLHNAVNRRTTTGEPAGGWLPEHRVSLETALRAYTANAAFAEFQEGQKGTLEKGKLADIVIWSQDLFRIDPMKIHETRALATIVAGKVVYRRDGVKF